MAIHLDLTGCFSPPLPEGRGISQHELRPYLESARNALQALKGAPPGFVTDLDEVESQRQAMELARAGRSAGHIVVLGIGGSALGTRTVRDALAASNVASRLLVLDNVDPDTVAMVEQSIDIADALYVVVSKSGSTAETISQFLYFVGRLAARGIDDWQRRCVFITDPEKGPLRDLANREDVSALPVPSNVGGRFSVLTPVGLFPAALLGLDIDALLNGARSLRDALLRPDSQEATALCELVALHTALAKTRGATIQVLMSYCDRLATFGDWFAQLWGESLGKRLDLSGNEVFRGSTPLPAVGATDQHSVVQLFAEGPADKQFLFLGVKETDEPCTISNEAANLHEDFSYLGGSSLGDLFDAERRGTIAGLRAAGRPCSEMQIDRLDAEHLGALFFFFEMATAITGALYEVNPYDQPGVEAGKIAAFALMGREGYENRGEELLQEVDERHRRLYVMSFENESAGNGAR